MIKNIEIINKISKQLYDKNFVFNCGDLDECIFNKDNITVWLRINRLSTIQVHLDKNKEGMNMMRISKDIHYNEIIKYVDNWNVIHKQNELLNLINNI